MKKPDWRILRVIALEVEELARAGKFTRGEFRRLYPAAVKATNGHDELLEFILNHARPEWVEHEPIPPGR